MTTTHTSAPLELLGAQPGISVIDPASVLTRLWYFDGKFLRAEGFRLDQQYVRSLVSLSNQAVGHGVVHGFDVDRTGGDVLRVEGGLALAPSGRVIHLSQQVQLSVAELIARSTGEHDPGVAAAGGHADFAPCPPDEPGDPVTGLATRPLYVLTAAATEALCGEEERFGQLCEDACATETDRSVAVEGVRFRVRRSLLDLPRSARVPFDATHMRSRVATAYFERERQAIRSMISGAGLRNGVWCDGAEGIGGEEVALGVFERSGAVTTWFDTWTARRELMESTPQRYWGWRFAMRPLDVFLAQVLQFQCQLLDLGGGRAGDDDDPCADERAALTEANDVLAALADTDVGARLDELRTRITSALSGRIPRSATGSLLLDGGIVTLPSGGYLPIDPNGRLEAQVRALMGPGVDLRFCAVRPDFIPEALQEAQHMERISLTQGIDDPGNLEEVDILVPGGATAPVAPAMQAFEGRVRLVPAVRTVDGTSVVGSALTLSAVARDHVQEGWSWTLAAHGEAPQRLGVSDLVGAMAATVGGATVPVEDLTSVYIEDNAAHDAAMSDPAFDLRLNRESILARERRERVEGSVRDMQDPAEAVIADRALAPEERRPVSLWFDVEIDRDLREVGIGGRAPLRLRASLYSRAKEEPTLVDVQVNGSLVVGSMEVRPSTGGMELIEIVTQLEGFSDPLMIAGGRVLDLPPQPLRDVALRWTVGVTGGRVRVLRVEPTDAPPGLQGTAEVTGDPRKVRAAVIVTGRDAGLEPTGDWTAITINQPGNQTGRRLADLELDEVTGALDPGSRGRTLGEAVIQLIGSELAVRGRDPGFSAVARRRLFEAERTEGDGIRTAADWVMFHRRRTKECGGQTAPPRAVRRFPWYHAVVGPVHEQEAIRRLAGTWASVDASSDELMARVRARLDDLRFELVTTVEFPEASAELHSSRAVLRTAFGAGARGDRIFARAVASLPTGDGTSVDLGRLSSVTSAVADLIDTSGMDTQVISEIPPEFQTPGIDGALFTVGVELPDAATGDALLVRRSRKEWQRVEMVAQQFDVVTQADMRDILGGEQFDTFVARFAGDQLTNEADVVTWWGAGDEVMFAAVAASPSSDEPDPTVIRDRRAGELSQALGFAQIAVLSGAEWEIAQDMVVFLVTPDR